MKKPIFCPACGHANQTGAQFCGSCGEPLPLPAAKSRRGWFIGTGVLLLLLIVAGLLAFGSHYFERNEEDDAARTASLPTTSPIPSTASADPSLEIIVTLSPVPTTAVPTSTFTPTTVPTPTFTPSTTPTPQPTSTLAPTLTPPPTPDSGPETLVIGRSINGSPIETVRFGNGLQTVIFVGGLHAGFAPATVALAQQTVTHFTRNPELVPDNITVYVIISANPDSPNAPGELNGRLNAHSVDLNRNWDCNWTQDARWRGNIVPGSGGSLPFSEPETKSLRDFILEKQPVAVIFWEARAENGLVSPGNCGVRSQASETLAITYGQAAGYQISDFEKLTNQVLNGDATNWLDKQGIPAIAVLLPQYTSVDWENNLAGIIAILQ